MSENNSASPQSVQGSSNSGPISTTPTTFPPPPGNGVKVGVVPIAAAPPKPGLPISAGQTNPPFQVTPKRQRRLSKVTVPSSAAGNQLPLMSTASHDRSTDGQATPLSFGSRSGQAPVTRAKAANLSMNAGANGMASVMQGAGMMSSGRSGSMSQGMVAAGQQNGGQEWEWLTMSL